jgi:CRISPR-associated protein Csh2
VFHFSINPKNLEEYINLLKDSGHKITNLELTDADIEKFKEAMNRSVTYLDSSRKIGSENEVAIYVKLTENSKKVIPSFTDLIDVKRNKTTVIINCDKVKKIIDSLSDECELVEIYYNPDAGVIIDGFSEETEKIKKFNIINGVSIR